MPKPSRAEVVNPRPASLVESLRAVGYSLPAAVADIVDNSISAGASNVAIDACWDGVDSYLRISDDGKGMGERELVEAMRLGTKSPLDSRDSKDLGRFGLGLKTASFSQCRRLTVYSKKNANPGVLRQWDIDIIVERDEWRLLSEVDEATSELLNQPTAAGTVVLWQAMDRVIGRARVNDAKARDRFLQQLQLIKRHLGAVFHRFLTGRKAIRIVFNGDDVEAWDPFLADHPATQHLPPETVGRGSSAVALSPFVLPHWSRLSPEQHKAAAGPSGWNAQQGFYIYRGNRLLVAGDWLGLGMQKEEHYKLARIAVELPNILDLEWAIDVKKSRARPPEYSREDFRRVAEATRKQAAEVYRHRGKIMARTYGSPDLVWLRRIKGGKTTYEINRDHPLLQQMLTNLGRGSRAATSFLRLVEETVPVHAIVADKPESHADPFEGSAQDLIDAAAEIYDLLLTTGMPSPAAMRRVLAMEPFNHHTAAVAASLEMRSTPGKSIK